MLLRPMLKPSRLEFKMSHPELKKPGPGQTTVVEFVLDPATSELRQERHVVDKAPLMTGADLISANASMMQAKPARA